MMFTNGNLKNERKKEKLDWCLLKMRRIRISSNKQLSINKSHKTTK